MKREYRRPEEHPKHKGWFRHPDGDIYLSKEEDKVLVGDDFIEPRDGGEYKCYLNRYTHLLKAETFLVKPSDEVKFITSHINGDKRDNRLENLEWVCYSENIKRAYENGLRRDTSQGWLKDLESGEVRSFRSLTECSNYLGLLKPVLSRYLNGDRKFPIKFKYTIWLVGEEQPNLDNKSVGKFRKGTKFPVVIVNDTEERYFTYIKSAKEYIARVGGEWDMRYVETFDEYTRAFEEDPSYLESVRKQGRRSRDGIKCFLKEVTVKDTVTQEVKTYTDIVQFCKSNNFEVGSVTRALTVKDTWSRFIFKFNATAH